MEQTTIENENNNNLNPSGSVGSENQNSGGSLENDMLLNKLKARIHHIEGELNEIKSIWTAEVQVYI